MITILPLKFTKGTALRLAISYYSCVIENFVIQATRVDKNEDYLDRLPNKSPIFQIKSDFYDWRNKLHQRTQKSGPSPISEVTEAFQLQLVPCSFDAASWSWLE